MIVGTGIDIVSKKRIEELYQKFDSKFSEKILSDLELKKFHTVKNKVDFLAKKFAAKEAVAKALGTGFQDGVTFTGISILNDEKGKPFIEWNQELKHIINDKQVHSSHISISDEKEYAVASVILEK